LNSNSNTNTNTNAFILSLILFSSFSLYVNHLSSSRSLPSVLRPNTNTNFSFYLSYTLCSLSSSPHIFTYLYFSLFIDNHGVSTIGNNFEVTRNTAAEVRIPNQFFVIGYQIHIYFWILQPLYFGYYTSRSTTSLGIHELGITNGWCS
jgi:hypothetical protein